MKVFKGLIINKVKTLANTDSYKWLLNSIRPFISEISIIVLLSLSTSVISVGAAIITKKMVDIAVQADYSRAIFFILLFAFAHIANIGLASLNTMISVRLRERMTIRIQKDMIARLYKSEWSALNRYHSGDILTRMTSDIGNVVSLWAGTFPTILALFIQLVLAFTTLFYFDAALAIFAFVLGPISALISWIIGRKLKTIQHLIQTAESKYRSYISEAIQNILIVKTFEYENESLAQIGYKQKDKYFWSIKKSNISNLANFILNLGYMIGYASAFLFGVIKISQKSISFGTFTAFLQLVGQVQAPFDGLSRALPQMISGFASIERLMEVENLKPEAERSNSYGQIGISTGLEVQRLSFSYVSERKILNDITFRINPGEITALIGVSGEGKTTLMRLLLALLEPNSGYMAIHDNSKKIPLSASTRPYFTYVPQGNTLFSGSISENLRVGRPSADDEELQKALKAACAWDFVQSLPNKMDTIIGESGIGLSEGQAQRICIARALLRPSPILLLDEATSALDMETERKVFENIRQLSPKKTCIAITHRLSVISSCDKVYRLENGILHKHDIQDFDHLFTESKKRVV